MQHSAHDGVAASGAASHLQKHVRLDRNLVGPWLLAISMLVFSLSDMLLALNDDSSQFMKLAGFGFVAAAVALRPRFHSRIVLLIPLTAVLCVSFARTFNQSAGLEEALRFLCPIMITIGLFAYREHLPAVLTMFIAIVATNDAYQVWAYICASLGMSQFVPIRLDSGLFIRAQGWIGFFSEFSFINLCAFVICRRRRPTRRSLLASWVFLVFAILGLSFKILPALALYPLTAQKLRLKAWLGMMVSIVVLGLAFMSGYLDSLTGLALQKIAFYILEGNSARAESYRVMLESLANWNFLGEGLGSFGGPASIKYNSPLYSFYHFNWFGLGNTLTTTDTFYPHLFVETGVIGGVIWLWTVLFYGVSRKPSKTWLFIAAAFCFDNVFSMAFVSPSYVFAALLTMYLFRNFDAPAKS